MIFPITSGDEICRIDVGPTTWVVRCEEVDDELASLLAFREAEVPPSEPNVHWGLARRNFDEVPDNLPTKVRTAIYQRMRE